MDAPIWGSNHRRPIPISDPAVVLVIARVRARIERDDAVASKTLAAPAETTPRPRGAS